MIGADKEDLLHGAGCCIETFEARVGGVLQLESSRVAFANFDPTRHDAADIRTLTNNVVAELVEAVEPTVLAFDAAEFHARCGIAYRPIGIGPSGRGSTV